MLFARVLVLSPGTSPPLFVLFSFLFIVGQELASGRVRSLGRGDEPERESQKYFRSAPVIGG